ISSLYKGVNCFGIMRQGIEINHIALASRRPLAMEMDLAACLLIDSTGHSEQIDERPRARKIKYAGVLDLPYDRDLMAMVLLNKDPDVGSTDVFFVPFLQHLLQGRGGQSRRRNISEQRQHNHTLLAHPRFHLVGSCSLFCSPNRVKEGDFHKVFGTKAVIS